MHVTFYTRPSSYVTVGFIYKTESRGRTEQNVVTYTFHKPDETVLRLLIDRERDSQAGIILRLAWQLGLMRREIRELNWSQVCLKEAAVHLPDRDVPIQSELLSYLAVCKTREAGTEGPVLSGRGGGFINGPYISRLARRMLDRAGQTQVRLIDLRHDYVVRQLEQHDWQYVAQITGIGLVSLRDHFTPYVWQQEKEEKSVAPHPPFVLDGEKLARLLRTQRYTPAGTLIRLAYSAGLHVNEMQLLTWDQIDLPGEIIRLPDRTVPIPADLLAYLTELRVQNADRSAYVVISKRTGKPLEAAYLSKTSKAALVAAGIPNITLSNLYSSFQYRTQVEEPVLKLVKREGNATCAQVAALLGVTRSQAHHRLSHMTAEGSLIRVGNRYFLPQETIRPEEHERLILDDLRRTGSAVRQDVARLLRIQPRQAYPILRKMVSSGQLSFENGRYYPVPRE